MVSCCCRPDVSIRSGRELEATLVIPSVRGRRVTRDDPAALCETKFASGSSSASDSKRGEVVAAARAGRDLEDSECGRCNDPANSDAWSSGVD